VKFALKIIAFAVCLMLAVALWRSRQNSEGSSRSEQGDGPLAYRSDLQNAIQSNTVESVPSAFILRLLHSNAVAVSRAELKNLEPRDFRHLKRNVAVQPDPLVRARAIILLAATMNPEAGAVLQGVLREELRRTNILESFSDTVLSASYLAWGLGEVAKVDDESYSELVRLSNPWNVLGDTKDRSDTARGVASLVASSAIAAIAATGRDEAGVYLSSLRQGALLDPTVEDPMKGRSLVATLYFAAKAWSEANTARHANSNWPYEGEVRLDIEGSEQRPARTPEESAAAWRAWATTEEGERWVRWLDEAERITGRKVPVPRF
jgi:hypothetical protein